MATSSFGQFITRFPAKVFKSGEIILLKDDTPHDIHVIESGIVKAYTISANGDERMVTVCREEEDFPTGFSFGMIEHAQYFYQAFTDCVIRFIPRAQYFEYLTSDIEAMKVRLARMTLLLMSTHAHVSALEQTHAGEKVAKTLLYMAEQFGVLLRPKQLKLSVTQQEIANSLGLTRETTNIELKKLELKHVLTHTRKTYILYMERLQKYLDDIE
jgi:CRP-like cAMP-binding protein